MLEQFFPSFSAIISLTALGAVFGLILSLAKIKLHVEKDPRIEEISDLLPGANCGACGYPGCAGYAQKVVEGKADMNLCPVGGASTAAKIAEIMGIDADITAESMKARVHCHGGVNNTVRKFLYEGPHDCRAANGLMGGDLVCEYGCLGYGDCMAVCPFDAISMNENRLPVIDSEKCTGCGKCVLVCPRNIISLVPETQSVYVMCRNREKAPVMKKGCTVGCIGCKLCEKACKEVLTKKNRDVDPADIVPAITVNNFLADIDYERCINCYRCVVVCPVPVIHPISKSKKMREAAKKENAEDKDRVAAKA